MATGGRQASPAAAFAQGLEIGKAGAGNKPGSVEGNHSSGTAVTGRLEQPTRESARNRRCGADAAHSPIWSCSGRGLPCRGLLPAARCALTAPFHPYQAYARRFVFCGTFHGLAPSRGYLAPCPKEPGLSSALLEQRLPGRLRRFRTANSIAFHRFARWESTKIDN